MLKIYVDYPTAREHVSLSDTNSVHQFEIRGVHLNKQGNFVSTNMVNNHDEVGNLDNNTTGDNQADTPIINKRHCLVIAVYCISFSLVTQCQ